MNALDLLADIEAVAAAPKKTAAAQKLNKKTASEKLAELAPKKAPAKAEQIDKTFVQLQPVKFDDMTAKQARDFLNACLSDRLAHKLETEEKRTPSLGADVRKCLNMVRAASFEAVLETCKKDKINLDTLFTNIQLLSDDKSGNFIGDKVIEKIFKILNTYASKRKKSIIIDDAKCIDEYTTIALVCYKTSGLNGLALQQYQSLICPIYTERSSKPENWEAGQRLRAGLAERNLQFFESMTAKDISTAQTQCSSSRKALFFLNIVKANFKQKDGRMFFLDTHNAQKLLSVI